MFDAWPLHVAPPVPGDAAHARALFEGAGLGFPAIPTDLANRLREHRPWVYATRPLGVSPYDIRAYVDEATRQRVQPYAVLAHAGHGVNSYAIHYYLVIEGLRMFVRVGWGGSYMDDDIAAANVREAFALADQVLAAAQAVAPGNLAPGEALTLAATTSYGSGWWPPGSRPSRAVFDGPRLSHLDAMRAAIRWFGGK